MLRSFTIHVVGHLQLGPLLSFLLDLQHFALLVPIAYATVLTSHSTSRFPNSLRSVVTITRLILLISLFLYPHLASSATTKKLEPLRNQIVGGRRSRIFLFAFVRRHYVLAAVGPITQCGSVKM